MNNNNVSLQLSEYYLKSETLIEGKHFVKSVNNIKATAK